MSDPFITSHYICMVFKRPSIPAVRLLASVLIVTTVTIFGIIPSATAISAPSLAGNGNITTLYVSVSGSDSGDCTTAPCATLKYAVEVVAAFMTPLTEPVPIVLSAGNYTASNCGVSSSRPLNISGGGKHDTVIDCDLADRLLFTTASLWMASLTVLHGYVRDGLNRGGGGVLARVDKDGCTISFVNCTFDSNTAFTNFSPSQGAGGGVYASAVGENSTISFVNCTVVRNRVNRDRPDDGVGGGVYSQIIALPRRRSQDMDAVFAGSGGGVSAVADGDENVILFVNCTFMNNLATGIAFAGVYGGGVYASTGGNSSSIGFTGCAFGNNSISTTENNGFGGGAFARADGSDSEVAFTGCSLVNNSVVTRAGAGGGGAHASAGGSDSVVSFTSCSFVNNSVVAADRYLSKIVAGGGAYASIDGHSGVILFLNCTVSVNSALLVRAYRQVFGGGVYAEAGGDYSSLLVLYCTVANNFVASEWYKQGGDGGGVHAVSSGNSSSMVFAHSTVMNNSGESGGGLYAEVDGANSSLSFEDCALLFNTATYGAGVYTSTLGIYSAISFSSCTVSSNVLRFVQAVMGAGGGFYVQVYGSHTNVSFVNCTVTSNVVGSESGYGGGVYVMTWDSFSRILMTGSTLLSNSASGRGGGMFAEFVEVSCEMEISNSVFEDNSAPTGGGVDVFYGGLQGSLWVSHCTWLGNSANLGDGGGLHVSACGGCEMVLTVANSKLSNNRAAGNGGAVFLSNVSSIEPCNMFLESTVWNNSANLGGAVYFGLGVACVGFNSCNIHSNQAIDGGGVYINATADLTVPLIDSVLRNNTAQNGGGIFVGTQSGVVASYILVAGKNSTVMGNVAVAYGGGIYFEPETQRDGVVINPQLSLVNFTIEANSARDGGGCAFLVGRDSAMPEVAATGLSFIGNSATQGDGGAIFASGFDGPGAALTVSSSAIVMNHAHGSGGGSFVSNISLMSTASDWINNTAASGGAVFCEMEAGNTTFNDCWFSFNRALSGDGGALFAVGHDSEVTFAVRESVFSNNQASGYGGGLYVSNISSPAWSASVPAPMFLTSEWRSNSAVSGGAVYGGPGISSLLFDTCSFSNNNATNGDGGAVFVVGCEHCDTVFAVISSVLSSNRASGYGGGIFIANLSPPDSAPMFVNSEWRSNVAVSGGAIYCDTGVPALLYDNCSFIGNEASLGNGGAIFAAGCDGCGTALSMKGSVLSNNRAVGYGGGVYLSNVSSLPSAPMFTTSSWNNNSAVSGGAVYCGLGVTEILFDTCLFEANQAFDGNGGAIAIPLSYANDNVSYCVDGSSPVDAAHPPHLHYFRDMKSSHLFADGNGITVALEDSILTNNTAHCTNGVACSGGAIAISQSGSLRLSNSTAAGNTASSYGGSVYIGIPRLRCAVDVIISAGSSVSGQTPTSNSSGIYDTCSGGVFVFDSTVDFSNSGINAECLPCPFGGLCTPTAVLALPGYWGAYLERGLVNFTLCPPSYCCNDVASCTAVNSCYGDRTGPLCGDCRPGYSESVASTACVPTHHCRNDARLFWPLALIGIFIDAFLQLVLVSDLLPGVRRSFDRLVRSFLRPFYRVCPRRQPNDGGPEPPVAQSNVKGDAKFKVFSYFTQMCVYVALPISSALSSWLNKLRSLFNIALPQSTGGASSWSQICAYSGLTATGKARLSGSLPFAVAAAMVVILLINWAARRACKRSPRGDMAGSPGAPLLPLADTENDGVVADSRTSLVHWAMQLPVPIPSYSGQPVVAPAHNLKDWMRAKYIAAGLNLLLTVYSSLLVTVVAMLHCVHVPGQPADVMSLYIQGSIRCDYTGWQLSYVFAAVLLVAAPLIIPFATSWAAIRRIGLQKSIDADYVVAEELRRRSWKDDVCEGVLMAFVAPYGSTVPWWEAVMMLHRLCLAFLFTFASETPAMQSLLSVMMCVFFLAAHMYQRPFNRPESQGLQTTLLLSLAIVALVKVFSSSQVQLATPSDPSIAEAIAPTNTFCEVVTLVFQYLIPVTALLVSYTVNMTK